MMDIELKKQLLTFFSGKQIDLVNFALDCVQRGIESESLWILAGMSEADFHHDKEKYFKDALEELNIRPLTKREADLDLLCLFVDDILQNKTDVIPGIKKIEIEILAWSNFHEESKHYAYDSIGFAEIYGMYDSYIEIDADPKYCDLFFPGRDPEEVKNELLSSLVIELEQWRKTFALSVDSIK